MGICLTRRNSHFKKLSQELLKLASGRMKDLKEGPRGGPNQSPASTRSLSTNSPPLHSFPTHGKALSGAYNENDAVCS